MGNTINSTPKGDNCREITEEVIQDLKEQIHLVDDTMCALAKTIDSSRAACELLLRQYDDKYKKSKESQEKDDGWENIVDGEEVAVHLLKTLDGSVSDQKRTALESLAKLLHCLIDTGKGILENSDENVVELSLDTYMSCVQQDDDLSKRLPYYEVRIDDLRKELKLANELNKQCRDEINILDEKEKNGRKEINILRQAQSDMKEKLKNAEVEKEQTEKQIHELEIRIQNMNQETEFSRKTMSISETESTDIDYSAREFDRENRATSASPEKNSELTNLRIKLENMKTDKNSLEEELNRLKKKQCIHVQLLNRSSSVTPTDELLSKIKAQVETQSSVVHVITQDNVATIKPDIPLLLFCLSSQGLHQSASRALDNIEGLHRVALVIVHRDTKPSFIRASNLVLLGDKFKRLCGIFDIICGFQAGIYECDLNTRNIEGLIAFVEGKGVRISALETYGLC